MKKMHSYCRLALFSVQVQGWHVYIRKKARNKGTQLQHRNRLLYTKDKKAGEIKRRNQGEERHPDKRNKRIKKYKKKDSVFLISCLLFPFCACQRIGISASEREEKD